MISDLANTVAFFLQKIGFDAFLTFAQISNFGNVPENFWCHSNQHNKDMEQ